MAATGSASFEQPFKGKDGKYQIRIESYDPARNTMKAIWLVSRNQRLLSQLLDKCEVSNNETSNEALRGNLLSVQRELQELRQAMDHHDGTQTPVFDTSDLGIEKGFDEDLTTFDSTAVSSGGESSLASVSAPTEDTCQIERASSAFGFGASNRRRSVLALSQIPKYSRPSIRTDFCISSFEPFPSIRVGPSKIPKCPPPPSREKKGKKPKSSAPPRPKTSMSGRGSRLSSYDDRPGTTTRSILKTSPLNKRPATSMALTHSATKKVSFGDPIEEPRKSSCQSRSTSSEKKRSKTQTVAKPKTRQTDVRPSTSLGVVRTIPRSSSRMSGMESIKSRSGRLSAMETTTSSSSLSSTAKKKSSTSRKSTTTSHTELRTGSKSKAVEKSTTVRSKKTSLTTTSSAAKSSPTTTTTTTSCRSSSGGGSAGSKSLTSSGKSLKSLKMEARKARRTVRSKSAMDMPSVLHPDVLPFESPPPQPKLLSQPQSLTSLTENTSEDSASAMIRSVSIIDDDDSDLGGDPFDEVKRTLPRIRVGEGEPSEYKVKAYFLDELEDFQMPSSLVNSGVIPSSPVEVDGAASTTTTVTAIASVQRDVSSSSPTSKPRSTTTTTTTTNTTRTTTMHEDVIAASTICDVPSSTGLETGSAEQLCNNTDGAKVDAIKIATSVSESPRKSASIEATYRDPKHETTSFPELGMDFLPEFENEVNGLLDTLMSQDLLTNTFSQDLRLFSTESNFMESTTDANEPSSTPQRFSEQEEVLLEDTIKEAIQEENEMLQTIIEDAKDLSPQAKNAAPVDPVMEEPSTAAMMMMDSQIAEITNKDDSIPDIVSETEGEEDNNDVDGDPEDIVAVDDICVVEVVENEENLPNGVVVVVDPATTIHHLSSKSTEDPHSCTSEAFSKSIEESLRRKSTGSYDAAALPLSTTAAMKPCGHRRSASHNELDAMMTNNDGYDKQTPSPGITKEDGAIQLQWSGESAADPTAETCSMFSSSELTMPDTYETYHDVHHGYSPSFATIDIHGENLSRQMALVPSPRPRQASFDFLMGNRAHLQQHTSLVGDISDPRKSLIIPTSTLLRYESESSGEVLSAAGGEFVETEELSTFDVQSTVSRDLFLKSTTTDPYGTWDNSRNNKELELRSHVSEEESEGRYSSVIPTSLYLQTDDEGDQLGEVPSTDVTMNEIRLPASSRRSLASSSIVLPQNNHQTPSKGQKKWMKSCGLFRLLTCTTRLEKTDVC